MRISAVALCIALAAPVVHATAEWESRHFVVVGGIGGESFYEELFHRWAVSFLDLASAHLQVEPGNIVYLAETPSRAPARIAGPSRKEEIDRALRAVALRSRPGDLVVLLLIGHGTARDGRVLFNLPGPDISAEELGALLDTLPDRRIVVVNAASSSGPFVDALSKPGRIVITATSSGAENQHPRFGGHFVTAFAAGAADGDKDGRVSVLEAFIFATGQVGRDYASEQRLQTEHALLDDDGDGLGSRSPGGDATDGRVAAQVFLARANVRGSASPEVLALAVDARAIVDRVESLKRRKQELTEAEYLARLESLLVELALNRRAIRERSSP